MDTCAIVVAYGGNNVVVPVTVFRNKEEAEAFLTSFFGTPGTVKENKFDGSEEVFQETVWIRPRMSKEDGKKSYDEQRAILRKMDEDWDKQISPLFCYYYGDGGPWKIAIREIQFAAIKQFPFDQD